MKSLLTVDEVFIFSLWYYPSHFAFHVDDVASAFHNQGIKVTIVCVDPSGYDNSYFDPFRHMFVSGAKKSPYKILRVKISTLFDRGIYNPIVSLAETHRVRKIILNRSINKRIAFFHFFDTFVPYFNKNTIPNLKIGWLYYAGDFISRNLSALNMYSSDLQSKKLVVDINMSHIIDKAEKLSGIDMLISQTNSFVKSFSLIKPSVRSRQVFRPFDILKALSAKPFDIKEKFGIPKDAKVLIYAGRPSKNAQILPELLSMVRKSTKTPVYMFIIGTQNYNISKWKNYSKVKKFITAIDYLDREQLFKYIKSSDLFVYPSLVDGHPKIINECQAIGIPVIGCKSRSSAIGEIIINNKTGVLVANDDLEKFAKEIVSLLNSTKRIKKIVRNAKDFVMKKYSNKKFVESLFKNI